MIVSFMLMFEKPQASLAFSLNVKLADGSLVLTYEPQRLWASTPFACMHPMSLQVATQVLMTVDPAVGNWKPCVGRIEHCATGLVTLGMPVTSWCAHTCCAL